MIKELHFVKNIIFVEEDLVSEHAVSKENDLEEDYFFVFDAIKVDFVSM